MLRIIALLALASLLAACPRPIPDEPIVVDTTDDAAAQARFDEAVALYEGGRFDDAVEAFQLFGAEFPADALAVRAELYLGRSLAAAGELAQARSLFRSLADAPDTAQTRELATLYLAFVDAVRGDRAAAEAAVAELLAMSPRLRTPVAAVIPGDEALLASLVAEARIERGDWGDALAELETVAAWSPDDALLFYGYDRAFEVAESRMDVAALSDAFDGGTDFAMTVTGPALAGALARLGDVETARAVLDEARAPMDTLGFADRWGAASTALAAAGGEVRARWGVVLLLSGPNRRAGRAALGGLLLAQDAFEQVGPESTMIIRDTGGTAAGTERAIAELAAWQVSAIVGPIEDDLALVGRQAAAELGIPYIALSPGGWEDAVGASWRLQIDAAAEAETAVDIAWADRGATRFAIVRPAGHDTPWLDDFAAHAWSAVDSRGADVVLEATLDLSPDALQESAEAAAEQIARAEPDAIILALPASEAATFASWMAAQNVWPSVDGRTRADDGRRLVTWVGNSFMVDDLLLRDAADYLRGAILPAWFVPALADAEARVFADRFEATYGRPAGILEAFAYDAGSLVRRLLVDEAQLGAARIAQRLRAGVDLRAVVGTIRFDELGNPDVQPVLVTISGGAFVRLEP